MPASHVGDDIEAIGVLHDRQRRGVYQYVSRQGQDVSRDQAARALSISRNLAAFHLDRLAEAGFLAVSYRRLTGRQGPGAGRPSKLYRRSNRQIGISLPERQYELLARLFAGPLSGARDARIKTRLTSAARTFGRALGASSRQSAARGSWRTLNQVLDRLGALPYDDGGVVRLRNCPFDTVAASYPELVCGTNLSLVEGVIAGVELEGVKARLEPRPGQCCVAVARSSAKGGRNA
jgi:predicted ArsR family transcriptional regulator